MSSITETLTDFTSTVDWNQVPPEVQSTAKEMLRDCLGVALAGSVEPEYRRLQTVESLLGTSIDSVRDASSAAVLLSTAAHALDYDDIHLAMGGHPSSVVIGGVLGAALISKASAAEVYAGFLVGVETAARIGRAISGGHYHVGWHPTSVIGALSAAAGAARVLGLDGVQTRRALGLAAASASGTKANFGTFTKPLQVGIASRAGLTAALYARAGLTANETILDDQHGGYTQLFTESVDEAALLKGIGYSYSLVDPEPVIKLLPACGGLHAATWATIELATELDLDPGDIESLAAEVHRKRIPHTNRPTITSGLEGKFSTQYCIAVAAVQRRVGLADFEPGTIFEPVRQEAMRKATLSEAPDAEEWPGSADYATGARGARVTITLTDGSAHQKFLGAAPGYPGNPATTAQLRDKFVDCAQRAVSIERAGEWFDDLSGDDTRSLATTLDAVHCIVLDHTDT